jgi:hypothetical protein
MAIAVEDDAVGAVAEAVEGGGAEEPVGEGVAPLGEVEVGGDEGGGAFVAFGDEVVEVLVVGWSQGLQAEVVEHEERYAGKGLEASLVGAGGAGGVEGGEQLGLGGEGDVVTGADGAMSEGLCEVALAGAAGSGDEDRGGLGDEAGGGQLVDEGSVEPGGGGEVEVLEGFAGAEAGAAQAEAEFLLVAPGDLVADEVGEEIDVGEPLVDGRRATRRRTDRPIDRSVSPWRIRTSTCRYSYISNLRFMAVLPKPRVGLS